MPCLHVLGAGWEQALGKSAFPICSQIKTLSLLVGFDIRQLTDVSYCKLQHHLSCNGIFRGQLRRVPVYGR